MDRPPLPDFQYSSEEILTELQELGKNAEPFFPIRNWRPDKSADKSRQIDPRKLDIPPEVIGIFKESQAFNIDIEKDLYRHQAEAIEEIIAGKNVIITTPTASGKSLCYLVPILKSIVQNKPAKALFIFPTVALLQDQFDKVIQIGSNQRFDEGRFAYEISVGKTNVGVGMYVRDTSEGAQQRAVRINSRLLFTTPDSLHAKILPYIGPTKKTGGAKFVHFFKDLRFVVLDDVHVYRGVFGANVAYLMRRLRLICEKLGNNKLQFILTSATIRNPLEHSKNIVGLECALVDRDGSADYRKDFVLWNPGKQKGSNVRREPQSEALEMLKGALYSKNKSPSVIVFLRSIKAVESFNEKFSKIRGLQTYGHCGVYHAILSGKDRRMRQDQIKSRQVILVSATSALELGIDIGNLACCVMVGFPGTVASTLQRAGRVGRGGDGTVILVLGDNPLEQHLARNPDYFFQKLKQPEEVRIPLANKNLIKTHLLCHLAESKYLVEELGVSYAAQADFGKYFGTQSLRLYDELLDENSVNKKNFRTMLWRPKLADNYSNIFYTLRAVAGKERFTLKAEGGDEAGIVDEARAGIFFHEGAVWLHDGQWYRSEGLNYTRREIRLKTLKDEPDCETFAVPEFKVKFLNGARSFESKTGLFRFRQGPLTATRSVNRYFIRPLHKSGASVKSTVGYLRNGAVRPIRFETEGFGISVTEKGMREFLIKRSTSPSLQSPDPTYFEEPIHGVEHAVSTILPLRAQCDINDIFAISSKEEEACDGLPSVIIFDGHDGGLGIAKQALDDFHPLIGETLQFIKSCQCKEGCPDCLHLPKCERQNVEIDKTGAIVLLEILREEAP
ncbi:MAG: DEAD/DEAH box helicase [Halobacteria archaeon]